VIQQSANQPTNEISLNSCVVANALKGTDSVADELHCKINWTKADYSTHARAYTLASSRTNTTELLRVERHVNVI